MRIIGGQLRGRPLKSPKNALTRPTPARVREALFSALEARDAVRDAAVLDLFAGTGALGFEALSRGAHHAVWVEQSPQMAAQIEQTAREFKVQALATVLRIDLLKKTDQAVNTLVRAHPEPFDLVLFDPPYHEIDKAISLLFALRAKGCLRKDSVVALEYATAVPPQELPKLAPFASYRYGDTTVVLVRGLQRGDDVP
jgi:16S rRNA (guanine966-N2)-methyltransferase